MDNDEFELERNSRIESNGRDARLLDAAQCFTKESIRTRYSYNFDWLGRPIIQYPQDIVAMQEIVWSVRPDLVIETGIAHGGSLILYASLLALLDLCDRMPEAGARPGRPRKVLGIDIEIRPHNRRAIEAHPLANHISMIESSSVEPSTVEMVREIARGYQTVLVCLDSNHTAAHVQAELAAYAPLVTPGSYCVVFDTIVERLPDSLQFGRPWGPGNNPMTAVDTFLRQLGTSAVDVDGTPLQFEIDTSFDSKLQISVAPRGYLRRLPRS